MKKLFILIAAVGALAGCTTPKSTEIPVAKVTLTTPEQAVRQYTFQSFYILIPESDLNDWTSAFEINAPNSQTSPKQEAIEALFKHPNTEIIEIPIARAGIGESVTIDQTTPYQGPVDAEVVDGEVVYKTELIDLGKRISLSIEAVTEYDTIICQIHSMNRKLIGMDSYDIGEGLTIEMPKYKTHSVKTKLPIAPNAWTILNEKTDKLDDGTRIQELFLCRLLPPK